MLKYGTTNLLYALHSSQWNVKGTVEEGQGARKAKECRQELVKDGVVGTIGMSNYHASEMERAFQPCDAHGLTRPSVYQGLYNPLNRAVGVNCGCLEQVAATDYEVRVLEVFQEAPRFDSHPASRLGCLDRKLASFHPYSKPQHSREQL